MAREREALKNQVIGTLRDVYDPEAWRDDRAALSVEEGRFLHVTAKPSTMSPSKCNKVRF